MNNWLTGWAQSVPVNGVTTVWSTVISGILQVSVLGPVLFNTFVTYLDTRLEGILNKFKDSAKFRKAVDSLDCIEI